jgi:hypothetical protein
MSYTLHPNLRKIKINYWSFLALDIHRVPVYKFPTVYIDPSGLICIIFTTWSGPGTRRLLPLGILVTLNGRCVLMSAWVVCLCKLCAPFLWEVCPVAPWVVCPCGPVIGVPVCSRECCDPLPQRVVCPVSEVPLCPCEWCAPVPPWMVCPCAPVSGVTLCPKLFSPWVKCPCVPERLLACPELNYTNSLRQFYSNFPNSELRRYYDVNIMSKYLKNV